MPTFSYNSIWLPFYGSVHTWWDDKASWWHTFSKHTAVLRLGLASGPLLIGDFYITYAIFSLMHFRWTRFTRRVSFISSTYAPALRYACFRFIREARILKLIMAASMPGLLLSPGTGFILVSYRRIEHHSRRYALTGASSIMMHYRINEFRVLGHDMCHNIDYLRRFLRVSAWALLFIGHATFYYRKHISIAMLYFYTCRQLLLMPIVLSRIGTFRRAIEAALASLRFHVFASPVDAVSFNYIIAYAFVSRLFSLILLSVDFYCDVICYQMPLFVHGLMGNI